MPNVTSDTPIQHLPMIGPTYAKRLEKLYIYTLRDLLYHFPHRYEDLSLIMPINQLTPGITATIRGTVISVKNIFTKKGTRLQKAVIADKTGQIDATWFNQTFLVETLNKANEIQLSGKIDFFGPKMSFTSPEYEVIRPTAPPIHTGRLVPIYPETYGVSSKWLRSRIYPLLQQIEMICPEFLPPEIIAKYQVSSLSFALKQIHFPDNHSVLGQAHARLGFDELFLLQLASQVRKYQWQSKNLIAPLTYHESKMKDFINQLPFKLTSAQTRVVQEITADLTKSKPMNRLLQGDVGSGKTVVAAIAMYLAHLNGRKSVVLAPTEILAQQHYRTIETVFQAFDLKSELITASTAKAKKKSLADSDADIIVGTHALLYTQIPNDVGLVVVDEQHRFGVEQRAKLTQNAQNPHVLAMTATPIPRTIALTIYGELDVSVIDEMPVGRKPVKTWVVSDQKRADAYNWIRQQIIADRVQAFVVCPLIEESESEKLSQVKAVEVEYETLKTKIFPSLSLGMLHGRMTAKQKQQILDDFKQKSIDMLVSTPVIEVGIDIPNANIMVIEAAERFGLAQLHQLRGRVGRGDQHSYCLLFTSTQKAQDLKRLKSMEATNSGFRLAEIDLELRGPGEMYGLKQHGFSSLKIASFSDADVVSASQHAAIMVINDDPTVKKYPILRRLIDANTAIPIDPN